MELPKSYKEREDLVLSLVDDIVESIDHLNIDGWNGYDSYNYIVYEDENWSIDFEIRVYGECREWPGDQYTPDDRSLTKLDVFGKSCNVRFKTPEYDEELDDGYIAIDDKIAESLLIEIGYSIQRNFDSFE